MIVFAALCTYLMNRVRHPSVPDSWLQWICRTSSDGTRRAITRSVTSPTATEADQAAVVEEESEGVSNPAVIRPGSTAPRARGRRFLLLTEVLREARPRLNDKATGET